MDLQRNTVGSKQIFKNFNWFMKNRRFQQVTIGIAIFIIIYALIATSLTPQKYNLHPNEYATEDIISPKDVINEVATNKKIEQAIADVGEIYTPDRNIQKQAIDKANSFFNKVLEVQAMQISPDEKNKDEIKVNKLSSESPIKLAKDDYITAVQASKDDINSLRTRVIEYLNAAFEKNINDNENDLKEKKQDYSYAMSNLVLRKDLKDLGTNIGFVLIKPNMVLDINATQDKQNEAKEKAKQNPVMVKKYQKIVGKGELVTEEQISILKSLGLLEEQSKIDFSLYIGVGILVALLEMLVIVYINRFAHEILNSPGKLILICSIVVIELLIAKFAYSKSISGFLIPTAFATRTISILMKHRFALVLNIALSTFITLMTGYNIDVFIVGLIGGSAGAIIASKMHQRNDILIAGVIISGINTLAIFATSLINSTMTKVVLLQSLLGLVNGGLATIFTIGLLPFCETIFDIVTPMRLLELSNPNQPLLKKLLFEAPGTYHHSVLVGNLAEAAADAIGGNSLLARVGSYYHDIGKIKRPYFFKENQLTNENPHDKITPSLSTLIITSHIKDGVEMAKKSKLPSQIIDIIKQHHGTTLVKYFYVKAVNGGDIHEEIDKEQFRYEGPKPQTREAAIVMFADSVEAAVRSIQSPTKMNIEEMVRKIVNEKLEDGQLEECDITIKDINKIIKAFLNVLNGIYHDRVEYPSITAEEKDDDLFDSFNR